MFVKIAAKVPYTWPRVLAKEEAEKKKECENPQPFVGFLKV